MQETQAELSFERCCSRQRVLQGVSLETREAWLNVAVPRRLNRGDILFREGEPNTGIYCLELGMLKVFRTSLQGNTQVLRLVHPGEFVGHRSMLTGQPYLAGAAALHDSYICFIEAAVVQQTLSADAALAKNMAELLAFDLKRSEQQLLSLARLDIRGRLAGLLLDLCQPDGSAAALTRSEMGQLIGSAQETVSRTLQAMAEAGAIRFEGRKIALQNLTLLRQYAERS